MRGGDASTRYQNLFFEANLFFGPKKKMENVDSDSSQCLLLFIDKEISNVLYISKFLGFSSMK